MHDQHPLILLVNQAIEFDKDQEPPFRNHLGGSMIGRPCDREIWYGFRWAKVPSFGARMLRLFERGHKEEFRFVRYLRRIGIRVRPYSERLIWTGSNQTPYRTAPWGEQLGTGELDVTDIEWHQEQAKAAFGIDVKQWRILDVDGHFGGSLDGLADASFDIECSISLNTIPAGEEFLTEFKTHNYKSFSKLTMEGVRKTKPEHYSQMNTYMKQRGLRHALYVAVNKNDDDLYMEVIRLDENDANQKLDRARMIVHSKQPPNRISNSPTWFNCKYCNYTDICHFGTPPMKNCRTCTRSTPVADGQWHCSQWNAIIPSDAMLAGCDNWIAIRD